MVPEAPPNRAAWQERSMQRSRLTNNQQRCASRSLPAAPSWVEADTTLRRQAGGGPLQAEHSNDCWQFDLRFLGVEDKLC